MIFENLNINDLVIADLAYANKPADCELTEIPDELEAEYQEFITSRALNPAMTPSLI